MLSVSLELWASLPIALGREPLVAFGAPLSHATSPLDFWSAAPPICLVTVTPRSGEDAPCAYTAPHCPR